MALRTMAKDVATGKELGFANVGNRKPEYFHSTWAYVAALLLHRYEQLGILDADGRPLMQGSLFANADLDVELGAEASVVLSGLTCPECQTTGSMAMQGGCPTCTACSYSKCGG
jgi:ribonucleoside-diphosphate reductase alpha chain